MRQQISWPNKELCTVLFILLGFSFIAACSVPPKRHYEPNPPDPKIAPSSLKLAVIELEDRNAGKGFSYPVFGPATIPGYLYGTENVTYYPTQFGQCLAAELSNSNEFQEVDYHENWEKLLDTYHNYDLVVTGHLNLDKLERTRYMYGLSLENIFGLVGAPFESFSREVSFDVIAFRPTTPEQILWNYSVSFDDWSLRGMWWGSSFKDVNLLDAQLRYTLGPGISDFCTTDRLAPEFIRLKADLRSFIIRTGSVSNVKKSNDNAKESTTR